MQKISTLRPVARKTHESQILWGSRKYNPQYDFNSRNQNERNISLCVDGEGGGGQGGNTSFYSLGPFSLDSYCFPCFSLSFLIHY